MIYCRARVSMVSYRSCVGADSASGSIHTHSHEYTYGTNENRLRPFALRCDVSGVWWRRSLVRLCCLSKMNVFVRTKVHMCVRQNEREGWGRREGEKREKREKSILCGLESIIQTECGVLMKWALNAHTFRKRDKAEGGRRVARCRVRVAQFVYVNKNFIYSFISYDKSTQSSPPLDCFVARVSRFNFLRCRRFLFSLSAPPPPSALPRSLSQVLIIKFFFFGVLFCRLLLRRLWLRLLLATAPHIRTHKQYSQMQ